MDGMISQLIDFIAANRQWAFWIALVFAFGETVALVSIVIPSTAILVGVGALVATGSLSFAPIWAGAAVGALAGSTLSWWLGLRYGDAILRLWPMRDHPDLVTKGQAALERWGPAAIVVGHFFGPLRSVVFLMTGMSRMPLWRFLPFTAVGAVGWAYVVPKFGEVGGLILAAIWRFFTGG